MTQGVVDQRKEFMEAVVEGDVQRASAIYAQMRPFMEEGHNADIIDSTYLTLLSAFKKGRLETPDNNREAVQ